MEHGVACATPLGDSGSCGDQGGVDAFAPPKAGTLFARPHFRAGVTEGQKTKLKVFVVAVAAATALGIPSAPAEWAASAGGINGRCKTTADLGRTGNPRGTSRCTGRFPSGAAHCPVIT
ncbi:hypothetical protein ACSHWO_20720 [Streptomyces sp. HUAS TT3]|uniref:hypothetical protein n=1 Tax=Streptomyces sp. HUAS TT3 TaxID=3447510 RepID=UPI003F655C41